MKQQFRFLQQTLGPGILFASTAIGVSHLVQSTRAGAEYGFALLGFVIAANLFKYPFFEFGSRYANATGKSIIDGYSDMGKWMLYLYFLIMLGSMFFVTAAVGAVTAGFMENLFGFENGLFGFKMGATIALFTICVGILALGKFGLLDSLIKIIGALLLVSTLFAFIMVLFKGYSAPIEQRIHPPIGGETSLLFIVALMGWMPTAVDLSSWNSLWTVAKIKQTGYHPKLKETLFEFNLGYWLSAGLSICFVTLGAFLIFGTGTAMPEKSAAFANAVVELYTSNFGSWSYVIIAIAAFSIMFGTSMGVFDGYARSFERTVRLMIPTNSNQSEETPSKKVGNTYVLALLITAVGAFSIIFFFSASLKELVDLATTISFLISPVIAIANYYLVTSQIKKEAQPGVIMRVLSWLGILFLTGFSIFYLGMKLNII